MIEQTSNEMKKGFALNYNLIIFKYSDPKAATTVVRRVLEKVTKFTGKHMLVSRFASLCVFFKIYHMHYILNGLDQQKW